MERWKLASHLRRKVDTKAATRHPTLFRWLFASLTKENVAYERKKNDSFLKFTTLFVLRQVNSLSVTLLCDYCGSTYAIITIINARPIELVTFTCPYFVIFIRFIFCFIRMSTLIHCCYILCQAEYIWIFLIDKVMEDHFLENCTTKCLERLRKRARKI